MQAVRTYASWLIFSITFSCAGGEDSAMGGDVAETPAHARVSDVFESDGQQRTSDTTARAKVPFQELVDAGITGYLGLAQVEEQIVDGPVTTTVFTTESGPQCLRGAPYSVSTRRGSSNALLIFLGGGGACWSDFCAAFDEALPGIPNGEVLDPELSVNPFRSFHVAFLPYCDGSLFAGDIEHDDDGDGANDRLHAGLRNLSAALDVIRAEFQSPERIVLAGASGGGYGTVIAAPLLRTVFPDIPIDIVNDSGPGIARGDTEPEFVSKLIQEFGAERLFPESCTDCLSDGHLTGLFDWSLRQDPNLRIGVFSFTQDFVIGTMFLGLSGQQYEEYLRQEMEELRAQHPQRFQYMLAEGTSHTGTFGDITVFGGLIPDSLDSSLIDLAGLQDARVGDVTLGQWLQWMVSDDEQWTTYRDDP